MPITRRPAVAHHRSQQTQPSHSASLELYCVRLCPRSAAGVGDCLERFPASRRVGAGGADCRARGDKTGCTVLGRLAVAHQAALARLLAQSGRFRRSRQHRLAVAAGLLSQSIAGRRRSASPSPISPTSATRARRLASRASRLLAALATAGAHCRGGRTTWLVCEKECIPGEASLSLEPAVAGTGAAAALAATATASTPVPRRALPAILALGADAHAACPGPGDARGGRQGADAGGCPSPLLPYAGRWCWARGPPQQLDVTRRRAWSCASSAARSSTAAPTDAGGVLVVEAAPRDNDCGPSVRARQRCHRPGPHLTRPHRSTAVLQAAFWP